MIKLSKVISIFFVLIFLISSYFLLKGHYEQHKFDINKIPERKLDYYDYGSMLRCAFERRNWDGLALSENFKKKYKSKYDITEHAGRFVSYDAGSTIENGEELIIISYQTQSLLDFDDSESIEYNLYFRYKITDDKLLDDVEFVRMEKRNSMSGRIIEG